MEPLPTQFADRAALIAHVAALAPWAEGQASDAFIGGPDAAQARLAAITPVEYARTRNYGNGAITRLSPYITHGVLSLDAVRCAALAKTAQPVQITKFIQELAWRDFWQGVAKRHPHWLWADVEPYKTGFTVSDYAPELPEDIAQGRTGIACIDAFITELLHTGYLHNHARMYLASYVVHFRRVRWQAGARWFLQHLLDGDEASNNFSWQWVASTFSHKPYIFNLENVAKYFTGVVDVSPAHNAPLDATYEALNVRLFPHMSHGGAHGR